MTADVDERPRPVAPVPGAARVRISDAVLVTAVGAVLRWAFVVFSRGGPWGNFGYDPGVYYTSADALTFGRLPYDDFVLVHPPALTLALTP